MITGPWPIAITQADVIISCDNQLIDNFFWLSLEIVRIIRSSIIFL